MLNYQNIPNELKQLKQWVNADNGNKAPMCSFEDRAASSTDKTTWSSFEEALSAYNENLYDYIGFVFADNGYVGIDIDAGYDEYGLITPLGADVIAHCESYTEKSKSGRGFHIILKGNLPFKGRNNRAGVEIYRTSRYFIMTGDIVLYDQIKANQSAIDYVVKTYFPEMKEENTALFGRNVIYTPDWSDPVIDSTHIKLRPVYPKIGEGSRNICLTSLAGLLHNIGYSRNQIFDELMYCNISACDPPLDKYEVRTITNSVTRYKR